MRLRKLPREAQLNHETYVASHTSMHAIHEGGCGWVGGWVGGGVGIPWESSGIPGGVMREGAGAPMHQRTTALGHTCIKAPGREGTRAPEYECTKAPGCEILNIDRYI